MRIHSVKLYNEAKHAYVTGEGSAPVIARALGLRPYVVSTWMVKGGWFKEREILAQSESFIIQRVGKLQERIIQVERSMESSDKATDVLAYAKSMEMLIRCWSLLKGHPNPGTRKQPKEKPRATEEL